MQSVLYPWFVRVTRTITIDRQMGGWVLREDSGWLPASAGLFEYQPTLAEAFAPDLVAAASSEPSRRSAR